jgi:EAL domain-containing protein (putative c-di-GMP-specific phosphodiesterase class I)
MLEIVSTHDVDRAQGYLIARPPPIQQFADWWAAHRVTIKG